MHPIVREFITTGERLTLILENYHDKNDFLEVIFLKLGKSLAVEKIDQELYFELDQALIKGHRDPNIYMLFISFSLQFTSIRHQFDRASVIQSIGSSIASENLSLIEQSYYLISLSTFMLHKGRHVECIKYMKESVALVDKKHPRYVTLLGHIGAQLSYLGRLKALDLEDTKILNSPDNEYRANGAVDMKLTNAIYTGDYVEGFGLIDEYKKRFKNDDLVVLNSKVSLLKILSGNFEEADYKDKFFKAYVGICKFLLLGKIQEAKNLYQHIENADLEKRPFLPFYKYLQLHIELNLKNKGKSRLLLQELKDGASVDYIDDLFLARLQWLEMNREGAFESFHRLTENVNRYGAVNRLAFELQFVKEISGGDIFLLTNGLRNKNGEKLIIPSEKKIEKSAIEEKDISLIIGDSPSIILVKKLIRKFARINESVLITGETGTGKELVAHAIHEESSHAREPFLAINCGALSETLLQSELFGYVAGAFTGAQKERKGIFESAGKGTVFLDEFGDVSPKMQVSLLRVLESNEIRLIGGTSNRQIECKIVIATNIDLHKAVEEKRFREDLYFRLARFDIKLPSLRERSGDIPKLINYFLKELNGKQKIVSKKLLDALVNYRWPGNIRELKNEMERLKILHSEKELLDLDDFDFTHLQIPTNNTNKSDVLMPTNSTPNQSKNEKVVNDRILKIISKPTRIGQRYEFLKELFQQYKKLTRLQIMEIASISPGTASKDLEVLCNTGFIKKVMPTKSVKSHYFVLVE